MFRNRRFILLALAFILAAVAAAFWIKAEHVPRAALRVAQDFVTRVHAGQFAQAHDLTVANNGHVGRTPAEFERIAQREVCEASQVVSTSPLQSNGNRLRRLLTRREIEMPEVRVEFAAGACLLGVSVRHLGAGQWKVYSFARHAG